MGKNKYLKRIIFANLILVGSYQLFAPYYAVYAGLVGASITQVGFIWSAHSMVAAIFLLLFGKLENRLNKQKIVTYGFFLYSLAAFSFLLVNSVYTLLIILCINAMVAGLTAPAFKTMFGNLQDKGKEAEEWSWLDAGNMVSMSVFAAFGGLLLALFGFKGLFIAMGFFQLMAAIIVKVSLKQNINLKNDFSNIVAIAEQKLK